MVFHDGYTTFHGKKREHPMATAHQVRRLFGDDPDVATFMGCSVKRRRLLE